VFNKVSNISFGHLLGKGGPMSKARVEHGPLFKLLLGVYQDGKLIIRIGQGAMRDAK
jgi:hypothetical protein